MIRIKIITLIIRGGKREEKTINSGRLGFKMLFSGNKVGGSSKWGERFIYTYNIKIWVQCRPTCLSPLFMGQISRIATFPLLESSFNCKPPKNGSQLCLKVFPGRMDCCTSVILISSKE